MIKITKRGKGYRLYVKDKNGSSMVYQMTEKEYNNLVLKGWEDYINDYCNYAKIFCKYYQKVKPYLDKFCVLVEKICGSSTCTLKGK